MSSLLSTSPNYSPAFCFFPLSSPTFHPSTIHHPQLAVNHKSLSINFFNPQSYLLTKLLFIMAGDVTREQVTWLYEVVTGGKDKPFVSNEPGSEGDVLASYLSGHGITLIPWEIETSSVDSPSVTSVPFIPLSRSILHKYQPQADIPFTDYISPADRSDTEDSRWWSARICSREAVRLFYKWALAWRGLPRRHTGLMGLCGVHTIT